MKKIAALLLTVIMAASFLTACKNGNKNAADDSYSRIAAKGKLVVGLDDSFPPMGFRDDNGELVGFDIDLAREVCSRLNLELELRPIAWDSKDMELNTGNIDCIWNGFTMNGREDQYTFTQAYMKNAQVLVVLADSAYQNLADLKDKTLSLQKDSSAEAALEDKPDFKSSLKEVSYFEDNMKALMDLDIKKSDAVLMDEVVARYNIEQSAEKYRILEESLADEQYGVGFKKGDNDLRDQVQKTLDAMQKDGKMAEISKQWFGKDITT